MNSKIQIESIHSKLFFSPYIAIGENELHSEFGIDFLAPVMKKLSKASVTDRK